jgi:RNA polymerase sigma-70 factor (ECF subfamily)
MTIQATDRLFPRPVTSRGEPIQDATGSEAKPGVAAGEADLPALVQEHEAFVTTVVMRLSGLSLDVNDLVQQTFANAVEQWPKSQPIRSLRAWLRGIALHVVARARRRERLTRLFSSVTFQSEHAESPELAFEAKETLLLVYQALDRLPEKLRFAWILSEIEGVTGTEMAEILGLTPTAARSRLFRARKMFDAAFAGLAPGAAQARRASIKGEP